MATAELEKPKSIPAASRNPELHRRIKKQAKKDGRSVTKWVERVLGKEVGVKF